MSKPDRWAMIKRLRQRDRDLAAADVEKVNQAIAIIQGQMDDIQNERYASSQQRGQAQLGNVNVEQVVSAQRYEMVLMGQHSQAQDKMGKLVAEKERRQAKLLKTQRDLKAVEKLQEKLAAQEYQQQLAREQSDLDQWTNTKEAKNG